MDPRVTGHPRLFFTRDELARLRTLRAEGFHARIWENLRRSADWCLSRPPRTRWIAPLSPDPIHENLYDRFYGMMHDMAVAEHLAFAYAYSGETRYFDAARAWALALCDVWGREAEGDADAGKAYAVTRLLKGIAVSYDLLHDRLTAEDRGRILHAVRQIGGKYSAFFADPATHFGLGYEPHHGSVEAASLGLAALALLGEISEAEEWLDLCVRMHVDWLLPYALTPSGTHNQTSNFWISIMQYRCAFMDALRRVTGRDLFAEHERDMPIRVPLACAVGRGVRTDEYPQSHQSWLIGPSYGQIDYASPALLCLARHYRRPILQYMAMWDPAIGALAKSRYSTPHGEWMLFAWGGYAYAWYDPAVEAKIEPGLPLSFLFSDPDPNPVTHVNEAYARSSYEPGDLAVALRRGDVVVHAGGRPVFVDFTPDWPPRRPVSDLTLNDDGRSAVIRCNGVAESGFHSQMVTLERPNRLTIVRRTDTPVRWWCFGPAHRDGDTIRWPDQTSLRVSKGTLTAFDPEGHRPGLVTGMGLLKLPDPAPLTYPAATATPSDGELVLEVRHDAKTTPLLQRARRSDGGH